jgi:hypothetical protein
LLTLTFPADDKEKKNVKRKQDKMTRQEKARLEKRREYSRQVELSQAKTRQDKTRLDKTRLDKTRLDKTRHDKIEGYRTEPIPPPRPLAAPSLRGIRPNPGTRTVAVDSECARSPLL